MTTVLKHALGSFKVFLISNNTFEMVVCIDEVSPTQSKLWGREVLQAIWNLGWMRTVRTTRSRTALGQKPSPRSLTSRSYIGFAGLPWIRSI